MTAADHSSVCDQFGRAVDDHLACGSQIAVVRDVDVDERHGPQLRPVAHACHVAVRHVPHRAVDASQDGGAQRDLLHDTGRLVEVDDVADAVLVLEQHEQPGDAVLHQALRAEAERHTGDAGAGDQRSEVHAGLAERGDHGDRSR